VLFHPLLNVFLINSIPPSKIYRSCIFYTRLLIMLAIVCLLGSKSAFSFGLRSLQDLSISLNVYILLIPYVTFVPIELLLRVMLTKRNINQRSSKCKRFWIKCIKYFGIFLMVSLTLICIYVIL